MAQLVANNFKLVGMKKNLAQIKPKSDKFAVTRYNHIEFWCGDATNTSRRFSNGLGLPIVAKSDLSTGNLVHASYLLHSHDLSFLFTSPYSPTLHSLSSPNSPPSPSLPTFSHATFNSFLSSHGLGVRAVALEVDDAEMAYDASVENGAVGVYEPIELGNGIVLAEVKLYGDVVLRYVSYGKSGVKREDAGDPSVWFLPGFEKVPAESSFPELDFGLRRVDHSVGNVPELGPVVDYVKKFTGFHEFAEFTAEEVGTSESGMNSKVLANNDETILFPIVEPVFGTKRKSQIQTYLEHNEGAGIHHLALISEDIFRTLRQMRERSALGGFEFVPPPPPTYYKNMRDRVGDVLTEKQMEECEELGILVDKDDQGTVLQIFTKPIGDRQTIILEIIQRVGCMIKDDKGNTYQKGACGGFGKGNFSELFKSMEEYEKMLERKILGDASAAA